MSGRRGRPHQPFFFSVNWAKLSFVWYKNLDRSFFRFVIIHACDRQTDSRTDRQTDVRIEFSSLYRVCITCSAVKRVTFFSETHTAVSRFYKFELYTAHKNFTLPPIAAPQNCRPGCCRALSTLLNSVLDTVTV